MDAVRGYLRELRVGRQISQDELADAMGLSRKALIDWEMGRTGDIKSTPLFKAIEYLRGAFTDIAQLANESVERGIEIARQRLEAEPSYFTEEQQAQIQAIASTIPEDRLEEVLQLLEALQHKDKTDEWVSFGRFLKNNR